MVVLKDSNILVCDIYALRGLLGRLVRFVLAGLPL